MIVRFTSTYGGCHGHDIGRSKSYYHTIMTMTSIIGRSQSYNHDHDSHQVRFTSTYDSCHGHDCMLVGFTSPYDSCHGHEVEVTLSLIQS
jgi:hypothetical protein